MKSKESGMLRKVAKETWIKTSFWMPENAEEELKKNANPNDDQVEQNKPKMLCPYARPKASEGAESQHVRGESHTLKFKELITLKLA